MDAHNTLFEAEIGDEGLRLEVWEHCDHRGEFIVSITRNGLSWDYALDGSEWRV